MGGQVIEKSIPSGGRVAVHRCWCAAPAPANGRCHSALIGSLGELAGARPGGGPATSRAGPAGPLAGCRQSINQWHSRALTLSLSLSRPNRSGLGAGRPPRRGQSKLAGRQSASDTDTSADADDQDGRLKVKQQLKWPASACESGDKSKGRRRLVSARPPVTISPPAWVGAPRTTRWRAPTAGLGVQ